MHIVRYSYIPEKGREIEIMDLVLKMIAKFPPHLNAAKIQELEAIMGRGTLRNQLARSGGQC